MLFISLKKDSGSGNGSDWNKYKNFGKIDILIMLIRPMIDIGIVVHFSSESSTSLVNGS